MSAFEERFAQSATVYPIGKEPVKVSATPYQWRDPRSIPTRPWIFGHQIMRGQVGGKFAPGGAGKTTHEVATCLALATGRDFLGPRVWGGAKRAWLWNLEDNGDELARIIQATCLHWNISERDIDGRLFVDSALDGAVLKLATQTAQGGVVVNEPLVDALVDELKAREIDYLSVDPFISSHSVEENDNGAIDTVVKKWAQVATRANCGICLTHHVKKNGQGEVNSEHARGASSLVAACRSALVLNRMTPDEAKGWGILGEDRRRYFRVYDDKNNRAPPASSSDWYRLSSVDLGNGDGPAPSDNVGAVEPWLPPDAFEGVTAGHLARVQRLVIERGDVRENSQANRWIGLLVAEVLELDPKDPADRKKINGVVRQWVNNGALVEVTKPDSKGVDRKFIEVGHLSDGRGGTVSTPAKAQVWKGVEGGGSDSGSPPPPPFIRGGGVGDAAGAFAGGGKGGGAPPSGGPRRGLANVVFPAADDEPPPHARFKTNPALGSDHDEDGPDVFGDDWK